MGLKQDMRVLDHVLATPAYSCGRCGARFHTKKEKGQHKVNCKVVAQPEQDNDDEHIYGRFTKLITPEIKAQAAAEWAAMDDEGRLPDGWEWRP